jgi:hypothetical protein
MDQAIAPILRDDGQSPGRPFEETQPRRQSLAHARRCRDHRQNRDLLHSMNERTRLQLRLQQTIEGLSVAAISCYIIGLAGYVFKGRRQSNSIRRRVARHARSQATIYAARARDSVK